MILPDSDAFVAKKISFYSTGDGQAIALDAEGGACVYLDGPQVEIVEALSLPADMSTLESRLMQLGWETSFFSDLSSSLRELCQMGLISPIKDLAAAELKIDVQRYPYLAWPTKNRPQELMRGLNAWELFYCESDLKPGFIISDDSDNLDTTAKTALESLGISGTRDVHYLDREARRRFPDAFPAELRESITFALGFRDDPASQFGAFGANQNFILLLTAGMPVAMTDDDILPEFKRRHEYESDTTALFGGVD
ncbi:MAG: hypothetical protein HN368_19145, partial [Spirochaetales bacterium]|nr:hypothetical protein [Spirochaetales bacterium]